MSLIVPARELIRTAAPFVSCHRPEPRPRVVVVDRFDWRPDYIDKFLAREWDGRKVTMILPGIGACIVGAVAGQTYIREVITTTGAGTYTLKVGWNPGSNQIEGLGGGGDGAGFITFGLPGGGAQYCSLVGFTGVAGQTFNLQIGLHGNGGTPGSGGGSPSSPLAGDTWFDTGPIFYAQAGQNGQGNILAGLGGAHAATGSCTVQNGGSGNKPLAGPGANGGAGGGGAGGPQGPGAQGGADLSTTGNQTGSGGGAANNGSPGQAGSAGGQGGANRNGVPGGLAGAGLHLKGNPGSKGSGPGGGGQSAEGGDGTGTFDDVFDGFGPGPGGGGGGNSFSTTPDARGGDAGGWGGGGGGLGDNGGTVRAGFGTSGLLSVKWFP